MGDFVGLLQVLTDSTWEAIRLGVTEKFLAEGQPEMGRNGHVLAAVTHRCAAFPQPSPYPFQQIQGV